MGLFWGLIASLSKEVWASWLSTYFDLNASQFHKYYLFEQLCEPAKGLKTIQLTRLWKKKKKKKRVTTYPATSKEKIYFDLELTIK